MSPRIAAPIIINRAAVVLVVLLCLGVRSSHGEVPELLPKPLAAEPVAQPQEAPLQPVLPLGPDDNPDVQPQVTVPAVTTSSGSLEPTTEQSAEEQEPSLSPGHSLSAVWSAVTSTGGQRQDSVIPLRPEEEAPGELLPGGQSLLPGEGSTLPATILPEMTPLQRPGEETDFMDILHERISYGFLSTATWLDSFFGDERYDVEDNRSRFKFRYIAFREDERRTEYRPEIDFRLALPQLKKKTYLMITGDPNEDIVMSSSPAVAQGSPIAKPEDRNMTAALQYFFRSTERRSYSVMSGAKFHNGRPILFLGPRARYLRHLASWDLRFTEEVLWYNDRGWQSRTRLDLERPFGGLFFRTSWQGVWNEDKYGYPHSLAFSLLQPLDRNRAVSYEWVNSFQTWPTKELDEVLFVFRYRQRIWRDWLYLEIAPQERYPRDRSFHETPGIMFKLEMIVGDYRSFIF